MVVTPRRSIVLFLALAACRTAAPLAPVPAAGGAAGPRVPEAIRWSQLSAEHRAVFLQVYKAATVRVEAEAARRTPGTWAVVLDADETVIDNSAYQAERARLGRRYDPPSWHAWILRREAVPLPGASAFLARVRALGGRVAIVTNRTAAECPDTEAVFRDHGLVYDAMLCVPETGETDKNPRFDAVARGTTPAGLPPLEIVAFLGDNIGDFPGLSQAVRKEGELAFAGFGERFFVLPNPMYGSWERN